MRPAVIFAALGLALASATGYLASTAISGESQPTRTVTVNVATGARGEPGPPGPAGPAGPAGPPGGTTCPAGFSKGVLVINAPGGQVSLFTCLKD